MQCPLQAKPSAKPGSTTSESAVSHSETVSPYLFIVSPITDAASVTTASKPRSLPAGKFLTLPKPKQPTLRNPAATQSCLLLLAAFGTFEILFITCSGTLGFPEDNITDKWFWHREKMWEDTHLSQKNKEKADQDKSQERESGSPLKSSDTPKFA